ncbi:helix-turn-helix domain-containing protein, partial [Candidatus Peregrinibacteria bacterium]|nr:helix-turn-helix domain-containing protein [Candidatus Peregrinibacteria bacterium]
MKQVRKPISFKERVEIERMLEKKKSYRSIGLQLGRGHTVIKREVERNTGDYLPYEAQKAQ